MPKVARITIHGVAALDDEARQGGAVFVAVAGLGEQAEGDLVNWQIRVHRHRQAFQKAPAASGRIK